MEDSSSAQAGSGFSSSGSRLSDLAAALWQLEACLLCSPETRRLTSARRSQLIDDVVRAWRVMQTGRQAGGALDREELLIRGSVTALVLHLQALKRCEYRSVLFGSQWLSPVLTRPLVKCGNGRNDVDRRSQAAEVGDEKAACCLSHLNGEITEKDKSPPISSGACPPAASRECASSEREELREDAAMTDNAPSLEVLRRELENACEDFVFSSSSHNELQSGCGNSAEEDHKERSGDRTASHSVSGVSAETETLLQSLRLRGVLLASVAACQLFMQVNWTGPPIRPFRPSEVRAVELEQEGKEKFPDHPAYRIHLHHSHLSSDPLPSAAGNGSACSRTGEGAGVLPAEYRSSLSGKVAACCCPFCGRCGRGPVNTSAHDSAPRHGKEGVAVRCYCEVQLEQICVLGPPDMPNMSKESGTSTRPTGASDSNPLPKAEGIVTGCSAHQGEATAFTSTGKQPTGLLKIQDEARDFFSVDGEEVYELVRGLPYLWAACVLSAWLRKQSSHFPCRQDDRVDHALTGRKSKDFPVCSCPIASNRPLPVLTVFLWEARLAYVSQRVLRGPSAAVCPAPSLLRRSVDEYTEALKQISLLPPGFSPFKGQLESRHLLKAVGVESSETGSQAACSLLRGLGSQPCSALPGVAATPRCTSFLVFPSETESCLSTASPENARADGDTLWVPHASWLASSQKALLLLELALHLALYGRLDEGYVDVLSKLGVPVCFACRAAEVHFAFTGAEGIRRKYQQRSLAQLVVAVTRTGDSPPIGSTVQSESNRDKIEEELHLTNHSKPNGCSPATQRNEALAAGPSPTAGKSADVQHGATGVTATTKGEPEESVAADLAEAEAKRRDWKLQDVHPDADVLERPKLTEEDVEAAERPLDTMEQALLLAEGIRILGSNPAKDELAMEQLNAVATRCLVLPENADKTPGVTSGSAADGHDFGDPQGDDFMMKSKDWLLYSAALWLRCKAEYHRGKTVERACLQLSALIDQFNDREPSASRRLPFAFDVDYPSWWEGKRELAFRMMRMGCTLTAYESFKDLMMWEDAAECLYAADRRADAEELLVDRLKVHETPPLWCTLGDLRKDAECYKKAWILSKQRYARAQRSLGHLYFKQNELDKAAESYAKSLEINPMNRGCWFTLGCCLMRLGKWEESAQAFGRVVALEPDDGDAWGNLAAVHSQREAWTVARICIGEAVKHRRESWRMWDNYVKIAVRLRDVRAVNEGLRHYVSLNMKAQIPVWVYGFLEHVVLTEAPQTSAASDDTLGKVDSSTSQSTSLKESPVQTELRTAPNAIAKAEDEGNAAVSNRSAENERQKAADVTARALLLSTLRTLEFLSQHVTDQPELWRVLSRLQEETAAYMEACDTRFKQFRALQAIISRAEEGRQGVGPLTGKSLELQKEEIDALRHALALLKKAEGTGAKDNEEIRRRLINLHMTASSLALTIEKQDTYELRLQQPQLKDQRRQILEIADEASARANAREGA
ncbi:tetratricopeptide repeat-containing protein [Cystoisospora suis]|uniref:Tetratricopeptide repeat-containing protein n=1 Tax=Cystoisospora suis TaxID=483139 RepID=A0A2C6LAJ9_9APIC|nr:tetratricopeptide repeat-containing protein [Cystoisospora suis]